MRLKRPANRRASGFTLIEILVVMVIIGVLAGVVTIATGVLGRDTEVEDQAKRLWAVLTQVREESELLGRNLGVIVDPTSYRFVQFDAKNWAWKPLVDDELLAPRQLPPGLSITLVLDGREVVLKRFEEQDGEQKKENEAAQEELVDFQRSLKDAALAPQIMLLASGDVNSFDLRIEREGVDYRWHVHSKPDNSLDYGEVDAAP